MARKRQSHVPEGKLARLTRLGATAGAFAIGGLTEGAKRLVGAGTSTGNIFLNAKSAAKLAERLARMRGAAMKLGQLLSLQGEDLVPPEFAHALALLREGADVMPVSQLKRVLGREWGAGWEKKFERFDLEPFASASIGQVHLAKTVDGRELAVKVQYPGVAKSIDSDIDSMAALLTVTRVIPMEIDAKGIVAEAKRQLHAEADYVQEAGKLRRYAKLLAAEKSFAVPRVYDDLSTIRVLAMDHLEGEPIESLATSPKRDEAGALLMRLAMRELFEWSFVQTDPNFANFRAGNDGRLILLDLGGAREYDPALLERFRVLMRTVMSGDDHAIVASLVDLGFLGDGDSEEQRNAVAAAVHMMAEPLRHKGLYDFGASDLAKRANDARFNLVLKKRFFRAPPPETIFLLRKFVGTFLLLARMKARVDAKKIAGAWI